MSSEHLVQDWIDRCYLALEKARDTRKEEMAEKWQQGWEQVTPEMANQWILDYYGKPLPDDEVVELPKIDKSEIIERKAYNKVWKHNAKIMRRKEKNGNV